ncbi:MAG: aspartate dehydrogenase [Candidatus Diapherotrites archaeon]|nr:aspartate dehydrogenase [Candidatus Diapherotrites archaeon]
MAFSVGVIGVGAIGGYLVEKIKRDKTLSLCFVFDTDQRKVKKFPKRIVVNSIEEAIRKKAGLIVESASQQAVADYAPNVLKHTDMLILSVGALAGRKTEKAIKAACRKSGRRLFVPSGSIIGVDGIRAVKRLLRKVEMVTTKPPKSLGRHDRKKTVVYSGPARRACALFPRSVNISATISLNGIGFDKTKIKVISDPKAIVNTHTVQAEGSFGKFFIRVEGQPSKNPSTSSTAAISAFDTIKRVQCGINLF